MGIESTSDRTDKDSTSGNRTPHSLSEGILLEQASIIFFETLSSNPSRSIKPIPPFNESSIAN